MMSPIRLLAFVTVPLYVLDQLTKLATVRFIPLHGEIPVIPGLFNLVHVINTGSAFGLMKGWFGFHTVFGMAMAAVMFWLLFRKKSDTPSRWAAALILAGIFGNITDRIRLGHVIDFLDFYVGSSHWPAFNIADSAIVVSVGIFLWASWREDRKGASGGKAPNGAGKKSSDPL